MTGKNIPSLTEPPRPPRIESCGPPLVLAVLVFFLAGTYLGQGWIAAILAVLSGAALCFFLETHRNRRFIKAQAGLLAENERAFMSALDAASHGMAIISREGKWLHVNKAVSHITGYSADELAILDFQTITHPDDLDADLHFVKQVLDRKIETYSMEKRYIRKDGNIVWIMLSVSAAWDAAGNFRYFISQIQDINERKLLQERLRASEAKLRQP